MMMVTNSTAEQPAAAAAHAEKYHISNLSPDSSGIIRRCRISRYVANGHEARQRGANTSSNQRLEKQSS